MKTLGIIVAIHAALVGFALLFAGFMSLAAPSSEEVEEQRKKYQSERKKGFWRYALFCLGEMSSAKSRGVNLAMSHWPERRESRRMMLFGVACLAGAAIIGYFLGAFKG